MVLSLFVVVMMIVSRIFEQFGDLQVGSTEISDMRCSIGDGVCDIWDKERLQDVRSKLLGEDTAWANQVHGVACLYASQPGCVGEADGVWTDVKGLTLTVAVADCVPVVIYVHSSTRPMVAVVHSGWKGSVERGSFGQGVVTNMMHALLEQGARDMWVWVGPSISQGCYEFGEEAEELFGEGYVKKGTKPKAQGAKLASVYEASLCFVDVKHLVVDQLLGCGVGMEQMEVSDVCTYQSANLFSYRGEGDVGRRNFAFISLL